LPDEPTNQERIEALNIALAEEIHEWEKMGVPDPNMIIVFNPMQISMWVKSLTQFLANKGIIDEGEFMVDFKTHMLENLVKAREQAEPEVRRQRMAAAGVEFPNMAVPQGNIKKH
jgi:hypothetical protein